MRRPKLFCAVVISVTFGAGALASCVTQPAATAQTVDQRAYAVYGTWTLVEEQAAKVIQDPAVPDAVKSAIRSADARAKPTLDTLVHVLQQYQSAAATLHSAGSTPNNTEVLGVATENLSHWITEAQSDITDLTRALKGAAP